MGLTLIEASKLAANNGEAYRSGVIETFARESDILQVMPWQSIAGNSYGYNTEGALAGIAFRGVNEGYTASVGVINPASERLRIIGGDLDVDSHILRTLGMQVRTAHEMLKVKAVAAEITRVIIKGDSASNPKEFDGLQTRLTGSQLVSNGSTSGGDPLSLTNLDAAIDAVVNPTHIIMSKAMRRRLTTAGRTGTISGIVETSKDAFGKLVYVYNGLPILVPYSTNGGTEPLAFDEAGAGGGSTATSIYVVAFGEGLVTGIQSPNGMMVRDLGEQDATPVFRTRVEWDAGLVVENGKAAARLYGISNAAVTA